MILEALAYNETLVSLSVLGEEGSFMNLNFSPNFTDKEAGWLADALRYFIVRVRCVRCVRVCVCVCGYLLIRVTQGQREPHERGLERE